MGGKTEVVNQTATRTLSPDEIAYNNKQLDILDKQLEAIQQSNEFQQGVFAAVEPVLQNYGQVLQSQVADLNDPVTQQIQQKAKDLQLEQLNYAAETLPAQKELLQAQLDQIKSGGAATPEQAALIDQYTQAALESGQTDISRFLDTTTQQIGNEIAPSRGLRPGDTPITDLFDRAAAEAVRQRGQLQSNLQGANVAAKINLPLAISQLTGAQNQAQQNINLATQNFSNTLAQNAAANRLQVSNLLGGAIGSTTSGGLGLAGISPSGYIQSGSVTTNRSTSTSDPFGGLGTILSGVGALGKGLGAVGILSSRALKTRIGGIDSKAVLAAMRRLQIDRWNYKPNAGDAGEMEHIGPYAEDFRALFGYGDGLIIPVGDALGILFAAVKELARRQEEMAYA